MKRPIIQRVRSAVVWWLAGAMNWNSEAFAPRDLAGPVEWRDRVRWTIERVLSCVFALAYHGSDEELRDAPDVPAEYRSARQAAYMAGGAA